MSLSNKRILVGVTGGIAAYKAADLVRRLQDRGATVRVAMTPAAREFITPLTMQALSGHPVHLDLLDPEAEAGMGHIELARWADLILIAPASADFIADLCQGRAHNLLLAICLAAPGKIAIAPAMNQQMWAKAATQDNLDTLRQRAISVFGPASGSQACGDVGLGRMLEPLELVDAAAAQFSTGIAEGLRVVITAGPTREAIDPVRYISNHSSGRMGYALAEAFAEAGALVTLISGPVQLDCPDRVTRVDVISAEQMLEAAMAACANCDLFVAAAAVADYRPLAVAEQKIKKSANTLSLELTRNPDILSTIAALAKRPTMIGFAAETEQVEHHARTKLVNKKLDAIIANDVSRTDIGFNSNENEVMWIESAASSRLPKMNKSALARALVEKIVGLSTTRS